MMHLEEALQIISWNLTYTNDKRMALDALDIGQTREIAYQMALATRDYNDPEDKHNIWNEVLQTLGDRVDRVELAVWYHDALTEQKGKAQKRTLQEPPKSVSYLRNRGSDGAYDHFTAGMENVRAVYVTGHEEALEYCYDEYADACILPYSDPERGLHTGFRTLIARYGLKINGMVQVENREGMAMDYVLLRREVPVPDGASNVAVTLPLENGICLSEPLLAAKRCGLTSGNITKLPDLFANQDSYDLHFFGSEEAIDRYLFYLTLHHPRYELLGIYQKEKESI